VTFCSKLYLRRNATMDCTHLVRIFETDVEQFRVVLTKMMTRGPLSNMKDDEMLPPIKQER